jgi:hypothetical protein
MLPISRHFSDSEGLMYTHIGKQLVNRKPAEIPNVARELNLRTN